MLNPNHQTWLTYREQLYYFILKRVSDPVVAEDIVQDVLTKVFARLDTLNDDEKLRPWLYQITRNTIVDYYRKEQPIAQLPEVVTIEPEDEDASAIQELATCCIRPFVERLPTPYREAVYLSEIEGVTQKEVAQRQGISLSGAKSRVQRGRKLLKSMLLECCRFEFDHQGRLDNYEPQQTCGNCS